MMKMPLAGVSRIIWWCFSLTQQDQKEKKTSSKGCHSSLHQRLTIEEEVKWEVWGTVSEWSRPSELRETPLIFPNIPVGVSWRRKNFCHLRRSDCFLLWPCFGKLLGGGAWRGNNPFTCLPSEAGDEGGRWLHSWVLKSGLWRLKCDWCGGEEVELLGLELIQDAQPDARAVSCFQWWNACLTSSSGKSSHAFYWSESCSLYICKLKIVLLKFK